MSVYNTVGAMDQLCHMLVARFNNILQTMRLVHKINPYILVYSNSWSTICTSF